MATHNTPQPNTAAATSVPTPIPATPAYTLPANLKSRIKVTYDEIGPRYNILTMNDPLHRIAYLDKLKSYLLSPPPSSALKILELGAGAGEPVTAALLRDGRFHVTANDISTTQVVLGRALCGGVESRLDWIEADMIDLEFPDGEFDGVMGFYSLMHLPRDEQTVMFGRIRRWLRPGGYVLMNFYGGDIAGVEWTGWYIPGDWMFWSGWGPEGTVRRIEEAGLEVVFSEVKEDAPDHSFLWVIARAP
ncbi:hypothetical protein NKR19_g3573 [Coniochaeta hoffmannii]|uniref:Methyltransferase domain-containing protein n=1 Tax=Coniochaeta hoffmannii TaxID=91930 RepID=A0AA38VYS3_9PEZI|nr:hypothetical protein NKR19_g3573 [Coniochaeta hoffmannii]